MKALEKRADLRYPTVDEMMRAMSDPVGYVEAHGGVVGFGQRQLMPSSAPMPPVRLTPAPMTTPPPGSIPPITGLGGLATPVPTTLGGSTGEVATGAGKKGFLIIGALVVAAAVAAIIVVVSQDNKVEAVAAGSQTASGSDGSEGSAPDLGSAKTVQTGSDGSGSSMQGSQGSAPPPPPPLVPDAGTPTPTIPEPAKITLVTRPAGARIFVDGVEQPERTPQAFTLPRSTRAVKIVLKLATYDDLVLPPLVVSNDYADDFSMKKKKIVVTPPIDPNKGKGSGNKGSGNKGSGNDDSGLMPP